MENELGEGQVAMRARPGLEKVREDADGEWFLLLELADDPAQIERTTGELTPREAEAQLLLVGLSREDAQAMLMAARAAFARALPDAVDTRR